MRIFDISCEEQRLVLLDICRNIYLARNISLSNEDILEEMKKLDFLFRDGGYTEEDDKGHGN